jgi:2-polyprenyl-6-methoxyphenol hydroxylase-like FAD-dependent oxidoreductase
VAGAGDRRALDRAGLAEIGAEVDVFETTREVRALAVGINLLPHAVRELDALGLLEALTERLVAPTTLVNARIAARRSVSDQLPAQICRTGTPARGFGDRVEGA